MVRCRTCNGFKKILGLGNLQKDCVDCDGIGYIEDKTEEQEPVKITFKRGRPAKLKSIKTVENHEES